MATNLAVGQANSSRQNDWRQSIYNQLHKRKALESQFEEVFTYASSLFEKVDGYKSEIIELNVKNENLKQQLIGFQKAILAGGSEKAAKAALPNVPMVNDAAIISEAANSAEVARLQAELKLVEAKYKKLDDEHTALHCAYKGLENKHKILLAESDNMRIKLLALAREDADRLNADNERIAAAKKEEERQQQEVLIAKMTQVLNTRANILNPTNANKDSTIDNFDVLDDKDAYFDLNAPSKIPTDLQYSFEGNDRDLFALEWYCSNGSCSSYLATGGEDRKLRIWSIGSDSSNLVSTLIGSNKSITSIDVENDFILASSNDYATRIWYLGPNAGPNPKLTLTGHSAKVSAAKFLDSPNWVASGALDRTVKVWDINKAKLEKTYFVGSSCFDLVYSNNRLITGHQDSKLRFWAINQQESVAEIVLQSKVTSLDISKDGFHLLCSLRDNIIKVLDLRKMEVLRTFSDERFKIGLDYVRAKFSPDNQYISCGSNDGSVYIWNTNSAKVEKVLKGHDNTVLASCWSPEGKRMATVERGRKVSIWA